MPDANERAHVSLFEVLASRHVFALTHFVQILRAVASKLKVSTALDFDAVASWCEHYTGADLQALLYNAQLESIHALVGDPSRANNGMNIR